MNKKNQLIKNQKEFKNPPDGQSSGFYYYSVKRTDISPSKNLLT